MIKTLGCLVLSGFLAVTSTSCIDNVVAQENAAPSLQEEYAQLLTEIKNKQTQLRQKYARAETKKQKKSILKEGRDYLFDKITHQLIPSWFGTPWEFYGDTQVPQQGAIACGYFVNTILEHVGFHFDRKAMSQQRSEYIIQALTDEKNITRFRNKTLEHFIEKINAQGPGLYIIGLDNHTGYVVNNGADLQFCHSAYQRPYNSVACENITESKPLVESNYRVIGKILTNPLIKKWLQDEFINTIK